MRGVQVKNRAPAAIQITAEQILREARDREAADTSGNAGRTVTDANELRQLRTEKRKAFEDRIRRERTLIQVWLRYAKWEGENKEFERARSIWERAIEVDYQHVPLWLGYATMEMENGFINHARNVWDRAVTYLPRVDQLWYKYAYMEEMAGSAAGARGVFERWTAWQPEDNAWLAFAKFEERNGDVARVRGVFERYIDCHCCRRAFLSYAKWEERQSQLALARQVFERAMEELTEEEKGQKFYVSFADFEERCGEYERSRAIYKWALQSMPADEHPDLHSAFVAFEKKHGSIRSVEDAVLKRRKAYYEKKTEAEPRDYDAWLDLLRLLEASEDPHIVRETYERAVAQLPAGHEKHHWRRYIYLWINYALFEELGAEDVGRARDVLRKCLEIVPHESFTFGKIWVMAAHLEVRSGNLQGARMLLGQALGRCPGKPSLYRKYIDLEMQLGEVDRCRTLYAKFLGAIPYSCATWIQFCSFERALGESERTRGIYEVAVQQPSLDMPEVLWKSYIDFEIEELQSAAADEPDKDGEAAAAPGAARVASLFERLLSKTGHVKVWLAYARFSASHGGGMAKARAVFERALESVGSEEGRSKLDAKKDKLFVLEAWRAEELARGHDAEARALDERMPQRVTTTVVNSHGESEEVEDLVFPEEVKRKPNLKILERARQWAKS